MKLAIEELDKCQKELRHLKETVSCIEAGPRSTIDAIVSFVQKTKEPFHDGSSNPFCKAFKARKGLSLQPQDSKGIDKMIDKEKKSNAQTTSGVMLLSLDPILSFEFHHQCSKSLVATTTTSETVNARDEIWRKILRVTQNVVMAKRMTGPIVQRIVSAAGEEGSFLRVANDVLEVWQEGTAVEEWKKNLGRDLRKNAGELHEVLAIERMVKQRWKDVSSSVFIPTAADVYLTTGNARAMREGVIQSKGLRIKVMDPTPLMLKCKRSKLIPMFEQSVELITFILDVGQELPERVIYDETWSLYEQVKMAEAFCNNKWFRKTLLAVHANVTGAESLVSTMIPNTAPTKALRFIKERLRAISRTPTNLPLANIHLYTPQDNSKLTDVIVRAIADLYLSRNVQKGF